jgi:nucleotide-binding universal stress UspA family protein
MFDKILLAVDGSEPSKRAVHMAAELASKLGSEVDARAGEDGGEGGSVRSGDR